MVQERNTALDIENAGGNVTLEKPGDHEVNVRVAADAAIDASLLVSDREGSWFTHKTYSAVSDIDDVGLDLTERYVRFEVTTGTGTAGDTADVLISSAGGRH